MQKSPLDTIRPANLLTYLSLTTAAMAMWSAMHVHRLSYCGIYLGISVIADIFDGRFARMFRRDSLQTAFGGQIDSLVDAVAFGVAPIVCLWEVIPGLDSVALWFSILYALCALTRLGFFNVTQSEKPDVFVGLTTTLSGLVWLVVFLFQDSLRTHPWIVNVALCGMAVAMVAPFRYPKPGVKGMGAIAVLVAILIGFHIFHARAF